MGTAKKEIQFPASLCFKSIFKTREGIADEIKKIATAHNVNCEIKSKKSSGGKFTSYSIHGKFPSNKALNTICSRIAALDSFMTLF